MKKFLLLLAFCPILSAQAFTWPTATPAEQGIDPQGIQRTIELIPSGAYGDIRSLIIIKNGQLVTEQYFSDSGAKAPIFSVTKSIGSTLLGIAKYQGADIDLDRSMMSYMPQYTNILEIQARNQISLRDLLTQRHGLDWDEWAVPFEDPSNPISIMLATDDWYRTVVEWPLAFRPDQDFAYSTGASSLQSIVLNNVTDTTTQFFAQANLFLPLDITDVHWELSDGNGIMGQGITDFPHGLAPLGYGLWMKPIDMAKIGELFRLGGVWKGQRLLDQSWIDESIKSYSTIDTDPDIFTAESFGYGLQWWQLDFIDTRGRTYESYYAHGFGRQFIFVFPQVDMVVVSTARDFYRTEDGIGFLFRNHVLTALDEDPASHMPMDNSLNGSWYWPENSGQGFNVEVLDQGNTLLAYWYTYDNGGNQRFFVMQGDIVDDVGQLTIHTTSGGGFVISEPPLVEVWGNGEMFFDGCNSGTFRFDSSSEGVSGEVPLTRLTGGENCQTKGKDGIESSPFWVH